MTSRSSDDGFNYVRRYIAQMASYMRLFLGFTFAFWAITIFLFFSDSSDIMALVCAVVGAISLGFAQRAWAEKTKVEDRLKRFGYERALDSEDEVK